MSETKPFYLVRTAASTLVTTLEQDYLALLRESGFSPQLERTRPQTGSIPLERLNRANGILTGLVIGNRLETEFTMQSMILPRLRRIAELRNQRPDIPIHLCLKISSQMKGNEHIFEFFQSMADEIGFTFSLQNWGNDNPILYYPAREISKSGQRRPNLCVAYRTEACRDALQAQFADADIQATFIPICQIQCPVDARFEVATKIILEIDPEQRLDTVLLAKRLRNEDGNKQVIVVADDANIAGFRNYTTIANARALLSYSGPDFISQLQSLNIQPTFAACIPIQR